MKRTTLSKLYDVRQALIDIYLADNHKPTQKKIEPVITELTKLIESNY